MKNLSFFSLKPVFFLLAYFREAKDRIGSFVSFFLIIINLNMVISKFLGLIDLIKAFIFLIYKFSKVIIIYKDVIR